MVNLAKIKQILDFELKPNKLGEKFEEINENAIKLFQKLFVENLHFDLVRGQFGEIGEQISTDDWSRDAEAEKAFIIAEKEEFRIIYIVVKNLTITRERQSIASLKRKRWAKKGDYICIFFAENSLIWDMVCPHFSEERMILRRYILGDGENHRTASENLNRMDASDPHPLFERIQQAFKVQVVTEAFFEDYKKAFFTLKIELAHQEIPKKEAHEFTLQLLNRIMFIYFISKKENWLNTKNFMGWLWTEYKKRKKYGTDEFYEIWLKQIFFKAFNNKSNEIKELPKEIIDEILSFPYLNGGLFTENVLDNLKINITDDLFNKIFDFFENYNFTIREDSPIDEEVAVDPQMIGYVYESLANVAEEIYDRHDLGIFYTPRVEVDFIVRRSLVEYLSNKLPKINKENLYHLVFDTPEEKQDISKYFEDEKFWYNLEEILDSLSVVDPACGSGAFLVGILKVLVELYKLTYKHIKIKRDITDFSLKKRIIQYSLYGVDIMPWAIHAAELRLWLQLMVETELKNEELRQYPLLPNLDLNLRIGDSLVQEIGELSFNLRTSNIDKQSKKKLEQLKEEKRNYFDNLPRAKFSTSAELREEEIRIFEEMIDRRINFLNENLKSQKNEILKAGGQKDLFNKRVQDDKVIEKIRSEISELSEEINNLLNIKTILNQPEKKPFIWDIDFAEIFGDKNGFDIVIGNPPYVRQEMISPPDMIKSEVSVKQRKAYKGKLIKSVKNVIPIIKRIDKRSDYYVYFYFHGLSLLNSNGVFCFITSNSWLNVGYGKELQEFLCKYIKIVAIYDNPKRSFAHADVNTVISLFGSPILEEKTRFGLKIVDNVDWPRLSNTAKFVMFKKPFEEVIKSDILIKIENIEIRTKGRDITENVKDLIKTEDFRVFPINQGDLLDDGWSYPLEYKNKRFKKGKYGGNKWGGKYLRAPDIFYTILEKGKGKFIELGNLAKIRRGFTTGANEFFYLDENIQKEWEIEEDFIKPVIKSPRELKSIKINPIALKFKIFICNNSKTKLKGKKALKYIEWGENKKIEIKSGGDKGKEIVGFNNLSTVKNRRYWYGLGDLKKSHFVQGQIFNDRFLFTLNSNGFFADCVLNEIVLKEKYVKNQKQLEIALNTTITPLFIELFGRTSLGGGALKLQVGEFRKLLIINPDLIKDLKTLNPNREIHSIFVESGIDPSRPIYEQESEPLKDRSELDEVIFKILGLTQQERKEVYWAVCELVNNRLSKSKTFKE